MIDNERDAYELIEALNQHLPMRAFLTAPLVRSLRDQGTEMDVNDAVEIDSVLYLGDEGGVACSLGLPGNNTAVVASITHLRIDRDHPLASRIQAYQTRRSHLLESSASHSSKKARANLAAKLKGKRRGVAPNTGAPNKGAPKKPAQKNDALLKLHAAVQCWVAGDYKRAADAFREVLHLERNDPYFSRYWLASCLFLTGSFDELRKLLRERDEHSGIWRFAQALEEFRRHGDSKEAQRQLVEADHLEPGFEEYLLRDKVVDASRQVRFNAGDAERAYGCARLFLPAWRGVPGAAAWARRILKVPPTSADGGEVPRRFPRHELQALPSRRETWQVGLIPHAHEPSEESPALWLFGVINLVRREMRTMTVIDRPPTETFVWNQLIPSLLRPLEGEPARPATLAVGRRELCDAWAPLLAEIGVRCRYVNDPQPVGQMLAAMSELIAKQELPPAEDLDIREFPQSAAVWQADFFRSPAWIMNEQEGAYRPWSVLVLDKSHSASLAITNLPGDPAPEMLLEFLVRTMARPGGESPQRPSLVEVADSDCYDHLRPRLEAAGVACQLVDELTEFNDFCLRLAKDFDGSERCALADGKSVTRAHMESFYEAAAYYFRAAPWRRVPGEVPIEIRCSDPPLGTRYAIVLGRTGVQLGLCIYDDWETTCAMLRGYASPEENRALAVCYDEAQIMSAVDLQLIDRLGWPIATPEAWPAVMRLMPRRAPRSATAEEVVFLDACLRVIPDFIKARAASHTQQVITGTRTVELHLAIK